METLELKPITINSTQAQQIFRVPEVLHNIWNMCGQDLPNMSALALMRCAPLGSCKYIEQIPLPMLHNYRTCSNKKLYIFSMS